MVLTLLVSSASADPINAVIGDASWTSGDPDTGGELERIEAHLTFVRARLARTDTAGLSTVQRARRAAALDALGRYIERGVFPRRTADAFAGRRPRFIDDRGVHCAVAQLIADSGHPALARALAVRFEYAYVPDIAAASEELRGWAADHGFTVTELAMIQPGYSSPPTRESTKREIEDAKDRITIACAALHPAQTKVKLQVRGNNRGVVAVMAPENTGFAKCVAREAAEVSQDRGAWDTEPRPFAYDLTVVLASPQDLFAKAVGEIGQSSSCVPRPGEIPREATIRGTSTKDGLTVTVQTAPRNEEAEACLVEKATQNWRFFAKGVWSLTATVTVPVTSELAAGVKQNLSYWASNAAAKCRQAGMAGLAMIEVRAKPGDEDFTITANIPNETFLTCVRDELRAKLRAQYAVPRKLPDGTYERYFRIDANVSASATAKL